MLLLLKLIYFLVISKLTLLLSVTNSLPFVASQDLQGKVVLAVLGHLDLLDQGVPRATWGCLDHRVLLASLGIVTPPRALLMALEVSISLLRDLPSYTVVTTNLCVCGGVGG